MEKISSSGSSTTTTYAMGNDGIVTFNICKDETFKIKGIPVDTTYKVTESTYTGYITTYTNCTGTLTETTYNDDGTVGVAGNTSASATVHNKKVGATIGKQVTFNVGADVSVEINNDKEVVISGRKVHNQWNRLAILIGLAGMILAMYYSKKRRKN